jgi:hypothetical protein
VVLIEESSLVQITLDLLRTEKNSFENKSEYKKLVDIMQREPVIMKHAGQPVMTIQGGGTRSLWDYAELPLVRHLERPKEPFAYDEQTFDIAFTDLINFFNSETVRTAYVVPLYNFVSNIEEVIELDENTSIRKADSEELTEMLDRSQLGGQMPLVRMFQLKYFAQLIIKSPKTIGKAIQPEAFVNPFDVIDKFVTALRLLKTGNVSFDTIRIRPVVRVPGLFSGSYTRFNLPISNWDPTLCLTGKMLIA